MTIPKPRGRYPFNVSITLATAHAMDELLSAFRVAFGGGDYRDQVDRRFGAASRISLLVWLVQFGRRNLPQLVQEIMDGKLEFPPEGLASVRLAEFEEKHGWPASVGFDEWVAARSDFVELWPQTVAHDPSNGMSHAAWRHEMDLREPKPSRLRHFARYRRGVGRTFRQLPETVAALALDQELNDRTSPAYRLPKVSRLHLEMFADEIAKERSRRIAANKNVLLPIGKTTDEIDKSDPLWANWVAYYENNGTWPTEDEKNEYRKSVASQIADDRESGDEKTADQSLK